MQQEREADEARKTRPAYHDRGIARPATLRSLGGAVCRPRYGLPEDVGSVMWPRNKRAPVGTSMIDTT